MDSAADYAELPIRIDVLFMNKHLSRFLGQSEKKLFDPQKRLEVKTVVPYKF